MRDEWKKECERFLFDFGKHVLGKSSGGIINKLMRERGISAAWNEIKLAAEKSDPREYLGAVIKEAKPTIQVGEVIGNHRWTGSRWAEIE